MNKNSLKVFPLALILFSLPANSQDAFVRITDLLESSKDSDFLKKSDLICTTGNVISDEGVIIVPTPMSHEIYSVQIIPKRRVDAKSINKYSNQEVYFCGKMIKDAQCWDGLRICAPFDRPIILLRLNSIKSYNGG